MTMMHTLALVPLMMASLQCIVATSGNSKFNPEILQHDYSKYVNEPVVTPSSSSLSLSNITLPTKFDSSNLLYKPDDKDIPEDGCIMGLALYKNNIKMFKRFVGSLRYFGYKGHIILGVSDSLNSEEMAYLTGKDVTLYTVEITTCEASAIGTTEVKGNIRSKCSQDITDLKLEWGRFEMARRWLLKCPRCTGWSMVVDTRDTFFQDHPFRDLGSAMSASKDLLFVEEVSPHTLPPGTPAQRGFVAGNIRSQVHTVPCYGKSSFRHYSDRPVLCSGSVIGTRTGMLHFLSIMVTEFYANNAKENMKCKSPHTTDQWIMNWLYYNGHFGHVERTSTLPWGLGPVLTVGKACMTEKRKTGATDLVPRSHASSTSAATIGDADANVDVDTDSSITSGADRGGGGGGGGLILNQYTRKVAPVVHQFDRCFPWISDFFETRQDIYNNKK